MMIQAHMTKKSAVPWWAAFGAPLFGVPLLVALLALGGGDRGAVTGAAPADAAEAGLKTEQVESVSVHATVELPAELEETFVQSRS